MSAELSSQDMGKMMLESLRSMPEAEQQRMAVLAGNAVFVLRMTEGTKPDNEVGRATVAIREALGRMVPDAVR